MYSDNDRSAYVQTPNQMAQGNVRTSSYMLSVIQFALFIYLVVLQYVLCVAAVSVNTPTLARRGDDLADFGQTVPILGQVSSKSLLLPSLTS